MTDNPEDKTLSKRFGDLESEVEGLKSDMGEVKRDVHKMSETAAKVDILIAKHDEAMDLMKRSMSDVARMCEIIEIYGDAKGWVKTMTVILYLANWIWKIATFIGVIYLAGKLGLPAIFASKW